jgi:hypothetical protein
VIQKTEGKNKSAGLEVKYGNEVVLVEHAVIREYIPVNQANM